MDLESARQQMIGQQLRAWDVLDERVLAVMAALPRELFVPPDWRTLAYADVEIPLGQGRLLPPPKIQGRALQALLPQAGESVLEVGSGTGYLTACLARLAGRVTAVESHAALAAAARRNLASLGIDNAEVLDGDGLTMEFPGRFDVVCVDGSLPAPAAQLEHRLAVGGRLFVVTGKPPLMQASRITRVDETGWRREGIFETCLAPLDSAPPLEEFVF
ncbi:MAG TPA: protein-L-isoaspartate O-methyltransferase [Gammaproteobacteria bacterium]|nr:protein-L-isoaspartate O-methyltransferase [Gammaproteobacteria bacterium]